MGGVRVLGGTVVGIHHKCRYVSDFVFGERISDQSCTEVEHANRYPLDNEIDLNTSLLRFVEYIVS